MPASRPSTARRWSSGDGRGGGCDSAPRRPAAARLPARAADKPPLAASWKSLTMRISMPSWATSQPAAVTAACSGELSSRTGLVLLMWTKMRRPIVHIGKAGDRTRFSRHCQMPHARAGLLADAGGNHLVVGVDRAVEQQAGGAGKARAQARVDRARSRECRRPSRRRRRTMRTPTVSPLSELKSACGRLRILQIERHLSGHGESLRRRRRYPGPSASQISNCRRGSRTRRGTIAGSSTLKIGVGLEHRKNLRRCIDGERLAFAQAEQAGDVIDIGIGQHHRADRRRAQRRVGRGLQFRRLRDLLADVGRGVEREPSRRRPPRRRGSTASAGARPPRRRGPRGSAGSCSSIAESRRPPLIR